MRVLTGFAASGAFLLCAAGHAAAQDWRGLGRIEGAVLDEAGQPVPDATIRATRFDEARAEYEKLLAARPDLAPAIHQQVGFAYIQERQYEKALESLERVLAAEPANAQIRAIAAQAALEGKLVGKARGLLASLDETQIQSPDVFFNMGVDFFNAGELRDAIAYFGKTLAKDPGYVDAHYRRALAYLGLGQTAEARADFERVVALEPEGEMAAMARKAPAQLP